MIVPQNRTIITVRIHPNADRNEIVSCVNGVLRINISASPEKGKANKMLVVFLSQLLATSKDNIHIIKGHTNRNKYIVIDNLNQESTMKLLQPKKL